MTAALARQRVITCEVPVPTTRWEIQLDTVPRWSRTKNCFEVTVGFQGREGVAYEVDHGMCRDSPAKVWVKSLLPIAGTILVAYVPRGSR